MLGSPAVVSVTKPAYSGDWRVEAARLLEKSRSLSKEKRIILNYFMKNISVGDIRSVLDLEKKGVKNAEELIEEMLEEGFLEKATDCYNLSYPLRMYIFSREK